MSIRSASLMAGKARIELAATDLLDRNLGVSFTNAAAHAQEERVNRRGRYVLLRFVDDLSGGGPKPGRRVRFG